MKKMLLGVVLLASTAAHATTNIDIMAMVTQNTLDTYGQEAVYTGLNEQIATANEMFNAGISGLDVNFRLKGIVPFDGTTVETGANCFAQESTVAAGVEETLVNSGHYTPTDDFMWLGFNNHCYTSDEQEQMAAAATATGADFVVVVDDNTGSGIMALAKAPVAVVLHYGLKDDWVLAHEFGHLLGLTDLYNDSDYDCSGADYGRLMCDVGASADTDEQAAQLFSDEEEAVVTAMLNVTDRRPSDVSLTSLMDIVGSGAGLSAERDAGDRTVTLTADSSAFLSASNPSVNFTVTMSEAADADVLVNVYSDGSTATAGTEYLDDVAQTITLAAGETSATFTLTANDLDFSGTRTVTVGISDAAGATADTTATSITITGDNDDSGSDASSGSGGGGSSGPLMLGLLVAGGLLRRYKK